jgi:hypothetical protein
MFFLSIESNCKTSFVINADGFRKVCESCGDAYYRSSTSIIDLPPDHPQKL